MSGKVSFEESRAFFNVLALYEEPVGIYYSDRRPQDCITPQKAHLPTYEEEKSGTANFGEALSANSCIFQSVLRARKTGTVACFDREHFGCLGGAFALGFNKPQLEVVTHYVSTGFPGFQEGERYSESPELARHFFEYVDPVPSPAEYIIFKALSRFSPEEIPELVLFFERPEVISGLHQLAGFVMNDPEVVRSPLGACCFNVVTWPVKYLLQGEIKAVLGGWDPSCRRYFRPDEINFTVPYEMFSLMVKRWKESFLGIEGNSTWEMVRKRIRLSHQKWGEKTKDWNLAKE